MMSEPTIETGTLDDIEKLIANLMAMRGCPSSTTEAVVGLLRTAYQIGKVDGAQKMTTLLEEWVEGNEPSRP